MSSKGRSDTQVVELIGRHHLTAELLQAGLEVATPVRDRGVDMIAYIDIDDRVKNFSSCPIQLKASTKRSFVIKKKYEKIHNLLLVYVWNLAGDVPRVSYALTYNEAFGLAELAGWTKTHSWKVREEYVNTNPGVKLLSLLEPYKMSADKWLKKITRVLDFAERETQKEFGRKLYKDGATPEVRARGLIMVIEAYYSRNPKAPNLEEYAAHWLWASDGEFDQAVMDLLIARFPLPEYPRIQRGYSDWDSFGNSSYRK